LSYTYDRLLHDRLMIAIAGLLVRSWSIAILSQGMDKALKNNHGINNAFPSATDSRGQ
jgi:hypothetical protein